MYEIDTSGTSTQNILKHTGRGLEEEENVHGTHFGGQVIRTKQPQNLPRDQKK
jgi:hypothetical protein